HPVLFGHSLGVVAGFLDVVQDQVQALQGVQVAEGVGLVAGKALDAVGQSIDAGGRRDLTGQVFDHPGVQNDIVGDHVLVDDAHLQLLFGDGDDGVGGDLGAGAGGGGDQGDGHARLGHAGGVGRRGGAVAGGDEESGTTCGGREASA